MIICSSFQLDSEWVVLVSGGMQKASATSLSSLLTRQFTNKYICFFVIATLSVSCWEWLFSLQLVGVQVCHKLPSIFLSTWLQILLRGHFLDLIYVKNCWCWCTWHFQKVSYFCFSLFLRSAVREVIFIFLKTGALSDLSSGGHYWDYYYFFKSHWVKLQETCDSMQEFIIECFFVSYKATCSSIFDRP